MLNLHKNFTRMGNDFWNNTEEFPNDNSEKSNKRVYTFETIKSIIKILENGLN